MGVRDPFSGRQIFRVPHWPTPQRIEDRIARVERRELAAAMMLGVPQLWLGEPLPCEVAGESC